MQQPIHFQVKFKKDLISFALDPSSSLLSLKKLLYEKTRVPIERQKLLGISPPPYPIPDDQLLLSQLKLHKTNPNTIMFTLMGTPEELQLEKQWLPQLDAFRASIQSFETLIQSHYESIPKDQVEKQAKLTDLQLEKLNLQLDALVNTNGTALQETFRQQRKECIQKIQQLQSQNDTFLKRLPQQQQS